MTLTGSAIHHLHTHMLSDLFKCRYCLSMFHTRFHMPAHHRLPHATLPECHVNLNLKALSGQRYIIRNVNQLHVNYLCHVLANTNLFHPRCRFALLVIFSCKQFATTQLSLSLSTNHYAMNASQFPIGCQWHILAQQKNCFCLCAPDHHWVKINFDEATFAEDNTAGLGVVIRNDEGLVMASLSQQIPMTSTVIKVEVLAAKRALELVLEIGFDRIVLEGDSKMLFKALKNGCSSLAYYGHLLQ